MHGSRIPRARARRDPSRAYSREEHPPHARVAGYKLVASGALQAQVDVLKYGT
eukprot:SAG11_NODE_2327_length_3516_cov_2.408838_1_plen_53_part_00